jgi:hypothetical protein
LADVPVAVSVPDPVMEEEPELGVCTVGVALSVDPVVPPSRVNGVPFSQRRGVPFSSRIGVAAPPLRGAEPLWVVGTAYPWGSVISVMAAGCASPVCARYRSAMILCVASVTRLRRRPCLTRCSVPPAAMHAPMSLVTLV